MAGWTLTVRHGGTVRKDEHETFDAALTALREEAEGIRSRGDLPEVSVIRTYEPGARVNARLEISTGGRLRKRRAGVDVMGNGRLVPWSGGISRGELEVEHGTAYDAIEDALR